MCQFVFISHYIFFFMNGWFIGLLSILYAGVAVISVSAYLPTIRDLYFHKKSSANVYSYALWSVGNTISFSYAAFVLSDLLLSIVVGISLTLGMTVLVLGLKLRAQNISKARNESKKTFLKIEIKPRDRPAILPLILR